MLVPWRSSNELYNGQRGHGMVPRIDMNIFDVEGNKIMDMPITSRKQIPSFADSDLIGYSYGFACKLCNKYKYYNKYNY